MSCFILLEHVIGDLNHVSTIQNYGTTASTFITMELIVHYVRDRLVSRVVQALYHDSPSISSGWFEVFKTRVVHTDLRASTACEAVAWRGCSGIVHANIIKRHYRIYTTDMVLSTFCESRIYDTHSSQFDKNIRLIILLEVSSINFHSICVLEWNCLSSGANGRVIHELYIIADKHIT